MCSYENGSLALVKNPEKQENENVRHQKEDCESWIEKFICEFKIASSEYVYVTDNNWQ